MQMIQGRPGSDLLGYTLLLAVALHAVVILGVGFTPETHEPEMQPRQNLRVVLVRPRPKQEKEEDPTELLAQVNNLGSGDSVETEPADVPAPDAPLQEKNAPTVLPPPPAPAVPSKPAAPTERKTPPAKKAVATTQKSSARKPVAQPAPSPKSNAKKRVTAAQLLASRSAEIARLTDELERKTVTYAQRPRRKAISASTTEYKYAAYLEAWRRKVERIGNLNYPDEARRKRLFGDLLLHVAVRADGSVERVRILHSSGHKVLDDSAIRIVKLAAPFAPFPPDIREETDVLDITRTWQFLSSNRLGWKK
jgi:protein TonB